MLSLGRKRLTLGAVSGAGGNPGGNVPEINEVLYEMIEAGTFDFNVPVGGVYELLACTSGAGAGFVGYGSYRYDGGGGASGCLLTAKLRIEAGNYSILIPEGGKQGSYSTTASVRTGEVGKDLVIYKGSEEYLYMKANSRGGVSNYESAGSGGYFSKATLSVAPEFIEYTMVGNSGQGRNNGAANKYDGGASPVGNAAQSGAGGYGDSYDKKVNNGYSRNGKPGYFKLTYLGEEE